MFETLAIMGLTLAMAALVLLKARERLRSPGARRSRGSDGDASGQGGRDDGGDGGD